MAFRVFRAVTATLMGISAALETAATGGALLRAVVITLGTGTCITMALPCTGATTTRGTGLVLGVSGIEFIWLFDNLIYLIFIPRSGIDFFFGVAVFNRRKCGFPNAHTLSDLGKSDSHFKNKEMAYYSDLPVYKATYDLLLEMFRFTKDFTKEYKYTVGESLKKETIELIILIYRANSKTNKQETLQAAREHIEVIRLLIRLMKDLHQINVRKFVFINQQVENVSKQLAGWQKYSSNTC